MDCIIFDLSWKSRTYRDKRLLIRRSLEIQAPNLASVDWMVKAAGCSALSSTYHSVLGTARSQLTLILRSRNYFLLLPRLFLYMLTWLPLGIQCYKKELIYSDLAKNYCGGYSLMSAAECDIRQAILWGHPKRHVEMAACIEAGLTKKSTPLTDASFLIGKARLAIRAGDKKKAAECIDTALASAKLEESTSPIQSVSAFRKCGRLLNELKRGSGTYWLNYAESLARLHGVEDQLVKISAARK